MTAARRRWPLIVIGAAAGASTWSGWVGLGSLTGFGVIHPLPGIWDDARLNTAITLPVGVEAYAVYALAVATGREALTGRARRYAWASAGAALGLGMLGQVAYHVMAADGVTVAPWQVVALVSCLPVLVLGAASLLWHLAGEVVVESAPAVEVPASVAEETSPPVEVPAGLGIGQSGAKPGARGLELPTPQPPRPVTVPDVELDAIIRATLAGKPGAGFGTVEKAIRDAGWLVGNTERVKDALRAQKQPGLRVVAGG